MTRVEFRFLHFVPSHVADDRITVGLLHWDGQALRFAWSTTRLPAVLAVHRDALERELKAIAARAKSRTGASGQLLSMSHVMPVEEGLGSALHWAPRRTGRTRDASAHFAELKSLAGLEQRATRDRIVRQLHDDLGELADELAASHSSEVLQKGRKVSRGQPKHSYVSPLSWKNGRWHHTVPASLAKYGETALADEARRLYGLLELSVPENDVAVVVAMLPRDPALVPLAQEHAGILRDMGGSRIDLMLTKPGERKKTMQELQKRIEEDLSAAAE